MADEPAQPPKDETTVDLSNPTIAEIPPSTSTENNSNLLPAITNDDLQQQQQPIIITTPGPYRGFSTSICSLFRDPEDCCGFFCCGTFQADRNYYLLHSHPPRPSLSTRINRHVLVPFVLILLAVGLGDYAKNNQQMSFPFAEIFGFMAILYVVVDVQNAMERRRRFRQSILARMRGEDMDGARRNIQQWFRDRNDGRRGHFFCCGCYPRDDEGVGRRYGAVNQYPDEVEDMDGSGVEEDDRDFCTALWDFWAGCCCGRWFRCWLQCCGACAIAQEAREVNRLVSAREKMIDYITFQPFREYFVDIQRLRVEENGRLTAHWNALSKLSKLLLKTLMIVILVIVFFAIFGVDPDAGNDVVIENLLTCGVFVLTFFQEMIVLFFVHWKWHRLDLSFDAVIKFFAVGFLFTPFISMSLELIESTAFGLISNLPVALTDGEKPDENYTTDDEDEQENKQQEFAMKHPILMTIKYFFEAYFVAGFVEELCKYYGFVMVKHPDFLDANEVLEEDANTSGNMQQEENYRRRSHRSIGASITVAMVSVACGFACCENLLYIIQTGQKGGISSEITLLLIRSLSPIHQICAAIQSVGVCRRVLENNHENKIGRTILPAIFFHGSFDFTLFVLSLFATKEISDDVDDDDEISKAQHVLFLNTIIILSALFFWTMTPAIYYYCIAKAQRKRLIDLDRAAAESDSTLI